MKKLLLILLCLPMIGFTNFSYASFPVQENLKVEIIEKTTINLSTTLVLPKAVKWILFALLSLLIIGIIGALIMIKNVLSDGQVVVQ